MHLALAGCANRDGKWRFDDPTSIVSITDRTIKRDSSFYRFPAFMTPFIVTNWLKSDIQLVSSYHHHHLSTLHVVARSVHWFANLTNYGRLSQPKQYYFTNSPKIQRSLRRFRVKNFPFLTFFKELFFSLCHKTEATQKDMNFPSSARMFVVAIKRWNFVWEECLKSIIKSLCHKHWIWHYYWEIAIMSSRYFLPIISHALNDDRGGAGASVITLHHWPSFYYHLSTMLNNGVQLVPKLVNPSNCTQGKKGFQHGWYDGKICFLKQRWNKIENSKHQAIQKGPRGRNGFKHTKNKQKVTLRSQRGTASMSLKSSQIRMPGNSICLL